MTCGIYKLNFANTTKCYIGQSVNIEKRFKQHLSDMLGNRASPKMQQAFNMYGLPISYTNLVECNSPELDDNEIEAIQVFDSVDNGFNTYASPLDTPSYTDHGYGNSKYSKESLQCAFKLLSEGNLTCVEIENISGVSKGVLVNIASKISHIWLFEQNPELGVKVLAVNRKLLGRQTVSDKLSAKAQGIIYKKIKSPIGEVFQVDNAYLFAREHSLAGNHLTEVLNGHRKSHKGWKLCLEEQV